MREELKKKIDELETKIFLLDMQDRWDEEDRKLYSKYNDELRTLEKQLEILEEN